MKSINYKMKLNRFVHSSKGSPWDLQLSRMVYVYKKNVKYNKNRKLVDFFWKTRVEASKVIMSCSKTLDFVAPIPLTPSLDNNNVIFDL